MCHLPHPAKCGSSQNRYFTTLFPIYKKITVKGQPCCYSQRSSPDPAGGNKTKKHEVHFHTILLYSPNRLYLPLLRCTTTNDPPIACIAERVERKNHAGLFVNSSRINSSKRTPDTKTRSFFRLRHHRSKAGRQTEHDQPPSIHQSRANSSRRPWIALRDFDARPPPPPPQPLLTPPPPPLAAMLLASTADLRARMSRMLSRRGRCFAELHSSFRENVAIVFGGGRGKVRGVERRGLKPKTWIWGTCTLRPQGRQAPVYYV